MATYNGGTLPADGTPNQHRRDNMLLLRRFAQLPRHPLPKPYDLESNDDDEEDGP